MLQYEKFTLENGLRVLVHKDDTTPMVAVNVLYDVGARDEDPNKTGFAHLFEHLMFGGSENIPEYDEPLQMAGGENNAYTTNDITNYYIQLPLQNIETAFWLESDRMNSLDFSKKSLDVQRKVVCEEFKENYINKPYGDAWEHLRTLTYKQHPYQWMTIGKELKHIEDATLEDVKSFFYKHYRPQNAVLCVAGNVSVEQVKELAEKWFGGIPVGETYNRAIPQEPEQTEARHKEVEADVPLDALYKAWHIGGRLSENYYANDLITEIIGNGLASRLHQKLVKEQQLFSSIGCYHTGSIDPGLLIIEGKVIEGKTLEEANAAVDVILEELIEKGVTDEELVKAKNKIEAMITFEDLGLLSRANNLAFYELLNDAAMINDEWDKYNAVTAGTLLATAKHTFRKENSNTLFYRKKNNTAMFQGTISERTTFENKITKLFGIQYPIIQAGMIWASGWRLASAVSNAGGLGVIGAGSMYPEVLRAHIQKCKQATSKPFGVNLPLLYPDIDKHIQTIIEEKVPIVFTSAGNPKTWTSKLKENGIAVVHVVSSAKFALKSEAAGVDAVVAEGFEAGGHNGREETTTLCLIPQVKAAIKIPLIAAGGIATGRSMFATMALGADAVQIGSRFVCSPEASSHQAFKEAVVAANEGDTSLSLKRLTPVRLLKIISTNKVQEAESNCLTDEALKELLGRARAKKGMFEGDMQDGELEIGQVSGYINEIKPAAEIVKEIWAEFCATSAQPFH